MNNKTFVVLWLLAVVSISGFLLVLTKNHQEALQKTESLKQLWPPCAGPGTSDGFACGIIYVVRDHTAHNGTNMTVVGSEVTGLEKMEVWSPISNLQGLAVGTKFYLQVGDGNWNDNFRLLSGK